MYFNWGEVGFIMNERGFTLLEMLISLSILLMVSTFIIPSLMNVLIERKNLVIENEATILLNEQVHLYYHTGTFTELVEQDGIDYHFYKINNQIYVKWNNRDNEEEIRNYEVA